MAKGKKTGGRQKGTPNKKTLERNRLLEEAGLLPGTRGSRWQQKPEDLDRYYRGKYGVSLAEVASMQERQGSRCAICAASDPGHWTGRFCLDHDHDTGAVRELLCVRCNALVGYVEKNRGLLPSVEAYIAKHGAQTKVA
jgi:hypothetical protein